MPFLTENQKLKTENNNIGGQCPPYINYINFEPKRKLICHIWIRINILD